MAKKVTQEALKIERSDSDHLKMAKKMRRKGMTLGQIANKLNEEGHKTRFGNEWIAQSVRMLLVNAGVDTSRKARKKSEKRVGKDAA